ncbi:MAG: shikimate kinase [Zoogloeaceae bacterium]|nr:shikimate kinase [Zoogloeaceae bacterium]
MGVGKTTIGRQIARRLERPFLDSDHEIEARTGVSIPTIFEIEGEAGFRRRETQMLRELTARSEIVLATGGGAVLSAENRALLRESGWIVYLEAPPDLLWERTRHDRNRPLLQVEQPQERLKTLYAERDPLYRELAHNILHCGQSGPQQVIRTLFSDWQTVCAS